MTEFALEYKTVFTILHLFGVALGAGGAFMSDGMFFISIKDRLLSVTELRFMKLGSTFTWVGLALLFLSGLGLFLGNPEAYMESSKFLTKIIIVLVITINGIYFHLSHIPFLEARSNKRFSDIPELDSRRNFLLFSGVVSVVSWSLAIILGALRSIPITLEFALLAYVSLIMLGCIVAYVGRNHFLPLK